MAAELTRPTHKIATELQRAVPFAVLTPGGQSGNFWIHTVDWWLWRKYDNEEHHGCYCSPNTVRLIRSRRVRWAERVERIEEIIAYRILVVWSKGKRLLWRPRSRWEDLKKEMGCEDVDWIHVAQDRVQRRVLMNKVINLHVPKSTDYFLNIWVLGT
jgi:hypothetical protein